MRHDGRVVVTMCEGLILDLPVTTEITSLPQLTAEGLPLALARRAAEESRLASAAAELETRGEAITWRALAETAHISLNTACAWLREGRKDAREDTSVLSVLHYSPYSTSDNMPAAENSACKETPERAPVLVDPPEAQPSAPDGVPLQPAMPAVCPAASHRLLWRWCAGTWHCLTCGE